MIRECLEVAGDELPDPVRLLLTEYIRFNLELGWWFYPSSLKETSVAHSPRNGENVRNLMFPLEDLYVDGQPAGQVGQEVYGAGMAFAFATRAFHRLKGGRILFCEYPVLDLQDDEDGLSFTVYGAEGAVCRAGVLPPEGAEARVGHRKVDAARFEVPVGARVKVSFRS